MKFEELEIKVLEWANAKDLIENGKPYAQYAKFLEEGNEILVAMNKFNALLDTTLDVDLKDKAAVEEYAAKDKAIHYELVDGLGDTLVTLIILAAQYGLDLPKCLEYAYNEIKNRTGKTVGGTFIKD